MEHTTKTKAIQFLAIAVALVICGCQRQTHVSGSMQPTIKPGEKVTVNYFAYAVGKPKRWDVVAFEPPVFTNQIWLARVIALPGEIVSFASGGIAINSQPLVLPAHITNIVYVSLDYPTFTGHKNRIASPLVVPKDCYFVLGDCSTNAYDSRFWGALPLTNILGRVRSK